MFNKQRQFIVWKGGDKQRWSLFHGSQERTAKKKDKENYEYHEVGELIRAFKTKKSAVAHAKTRAENSLAEHEILIYNKKGKLQKTKTVEEKTPPPPKWVGDKSKKKIKMVNINKVKPSKSDLPDGKPYSLNDLFELGYISGEYMKHRKARPVIVKKKGRKYQIVDGHHRYSYALGTDSDKIQVTVPYRYEVDWADDVENDGMYKLVRGVAEDIKGADYVAWEHGHNSMVHTVGRFEKKLRNLYQDGYIKSVKKDGRTFLS